MTSDNDTIVWEVLSAPDNLTVIEEDAPGELITIDEFVDNVMCGAFIDYDGYGYWANSTGYLNDWAHRVWPSDIVKGLEVPYWVTHILWFNR